MCLAYTLSEPINHVYNKNIHLKFFVNYMPEDSQAFLTGILLYHPLNLCCAPQKQHCGLLNYILKFLKQEYVYRKKFHLMFQVHGKF